MLLALRLFTSFSDSNPSRLVDTTKKRSKYKASSEGTKEVHGSRTPKDCSKTVAVLAGPSAKLIDVMRQCRQLLEDELDSIDRCVYCDGGGLGLGFDFVVSCKNLSFGGTWCDRHGVCGGKWN